MVVLLPKKADGLADFEKSMTADNLDRWVKQLHETNLDAALPKFKMTRRSSLKGTLSAMGMPRAFSDQSDFSGMDGSRNLSISEVFHQAFVDVKEEGTEAAAATGVVVKARSVSPRFVADHPFISLIRDVRAGSVLFLGRVVNPKREGTGNRNRAVLPLQEWEWLAACYVTSGSWSRPRRSFRPRNTNPETEPVLRPNCSPISASEHP
jgi:serpin B